MCAGVSLCVSVCISVCVCVSVRLCLCLCRVCVCVAGRSVPRSVPLCVYHRFVPNSHNPFMPLAPWDQSKEKEGGGWGGAEGAQRVPGKTWGPPPPPPPPPLPPPHTRDSIRSAHGWPLSYETGVGHVDKEGGREGSACVDVGGRGVVMMGVAQYFCLDPRLLDVWLGLVCVCVCACWCVCVCVCLGLVIDALHEYS
jgi:hypothetical protein